MRSKRRTTNRRTTKRRTARRTTNRRTTRRTTNRRTTNRKSIRKSQMKQTPKFYMITYEGNMPFAKHTKEILHKEYKIPKKNIIIVKGYAIDKQTYTHTNVIYHGIRDKLLPKMIQGNDDAYYIEDDIRFTENPFDIPKKDIVWSVYRNGSLESKKRVITGSQAIFFSKKAQKLLKKHMDESRPIQIDGYFSKFSRQMKDNKKLTFHQMKPKIGYEEDHQSLISKDKDWKKYKKPN
jgi:hypothetical protein